MVGTLVRGCRCAMSWCDLDLAFDIAYLMLFYLSTGICDTILSLLSSRAGDYNLHHVCAYVRGSRSFL